ncbi:tudor domain-containing protein 5 [Papilio machaon]|uniref:tudor domain-containing protein 5 n=1 Tax=Papilio machaon TaxID=76193 RepID=UPI001E663BD0|nr:tudor domain-containing protein 5 [Papilio machaon]
MMEDEIKELKSVLRSLVVSSPTQVDVRTLMRDYRSLVGRALPIAKLGYKEPVHFLRERCSDCFLFHGDPRNPVLTLIVPDTLKHIDKFVQKQKVSNTVKHKGKRRSVAALVLPPSNNLISKTFLAKEKESGIIKKEERDTVKNDLTLDADTENNQVYNGTSHSALENFMKKRMPLCTSMADFQADTDSSRGDADSGRQTFSSGSSTKWTQFEELKSEIKNILEDHPEGIWCTDLVALYRQRHGRELQVARFGFTSVLSLVCALADTVRAWRPRGAADWRLQHTAAPAPASVSAPATARRAPASVSAPAAARRAPAPAPAPAPVAAHIDPDDALPGVDYDPDVFPEDCVHFMESIPAAPLAGVAAGAHLEVIVGEVYSPSHFWLIRLGEQHSVAMEDMMDEMTEYYSRGAGCGRRLARGAVRVGQYCSSCYEGDWHRSLIVKLVDSDTVKVRHVDYGTVERCAVSELRPLLRRWASLPQQAVRARLAAVRPPHAGRRWPRAAAAFLLRAVTQRQLVALVSAHRDDIVEVLLIDTSSDEDVCINTEMVRAGYADPRDDSCLGTSECYLCPSFDALESGDTPTYAEIQCYLRDGIVLDYVEDYRRHVPPCLPAPAHPPAPRPPPTPAPRPPTPKLSAAENEIFYHLRQASAAHMYMMEALQRAIAATSLAGVDPRLNPEAAEFPAPRAPSAPVASPAPPAPVTPLAHPPGATGDNQKFVNPAVKRFFENVVPSAGIAPPPGFEHMCRRF